MEDGRKTAPDVDFAAWTREWIATVAVVVAVLLAFIFVPLFSSATAKGLVLGALVAGTGLYMVAARQTISTQGVARQQLLGLKTATAQSASTATRRAGLVLTVLGSAVLALSLAALLAS